VDQTIDQFIFFLMIVLRVTSLFLSAPVFSNQYIPAQSKIAFGLFVSFLLYSLLPQQLFPGSHTMVGLVLLGMKEVLTGASIGLAVQIIFSGVRFAGDIISFDMGFSMATVFDAENGASFPVISEMLYWFLLMIFILVNGHHFVLEAVVYSYSAVPIGTWNIGAATMATVASLIGKMFVIAIKIASPLMVSMFLANVMLGIMNKVMPQMNIFGVMFPMKIAVGFVVISATVPAIAFVFKKVLTSFEASVIELIKVM
jgi:flagellar biosynthetic protein FliR